MLGVFVFVGKGIVIFIEGRQLRILFEIRFWNVDEIFLLYKQFVIRNECCIVVLSFEKLKFIVLMVIGYVIVIDVGIILLGVSFW